MRALVTGATGVVGANLVRELLATGHEVGVLVRQQSDRRALQGLPVNVHVGDVLEAESLVPAVAGCEMVFHAAAIFAYWNQPDDRLQTLAVQGTTNVIQAAERGGVRRVVLTSSTVVLGSSLERLTRDEESSSDEADSYARAKIAQEHTAFACAARLGVDLVAVCPGMCLGPHDYRLSPSNAIISSYLKDPWKMTWPGGCNLVSVRDVARGHLLIAEKGRPQQHYVLGGENLEWAAVHGLISELCGIDAPKLTANHTSAYLAATLQEVMARVMRQAPLATRAQAKMVGRYYWYSHSRAAALGYAPRPARQAVAEGIAWLLSTLHIPMSTRATLRPSREVYAAWEEHLAAEKRWSVGALSSP